MTSLFDGMTNLYSLSKTLRFELKPVGKTNDYLQSSDFFKKDEERAEIYPEIKNLLDDMHREFIAGALSKVNAFHIDPLTPDLKKLRRSIVQHFDGAKFLAEASIVDQLLKKYPEHAQKIIQFQKFWGYFKTYVQNRANLYKDEGKAGQIATRLIDENLPRFLRNQGIVDDIQKMYPDFLVIEKNERQEEKELELSQYKDFFDVMLYHKYITQEGIDQYNAVVGHFNHSINKYKQQHADKKIPLLQLLYKLPLAPRKKIDWLPQQIETTEQLLQVVSSVKDRVEGHIIPFVRGILLPALQGDTTYDWAGIYVSLKTLEQRGGVALTGWASFRELTHDASKSGDEPKIKKQYSDSPYVSLHDIAVYLDEKQSRGVDASAVFGEERGKGVEASFSQYFFKLISKDVGRLLDVYQSAQELYNQKITKETQKALLDASMSLWRLLGGFVLIHKKVRLTMEVKESHFYDGDVGLDALVFNDDVDPIHVSYDKVRNYLTKKPYSNDEKIKVNFDNPTLLDGWDQNKERDNFGIVLRKDRTYYLALMKKGSNKFFDEDKNAKLYAGNGYEKMVYKLLPGPNKMLPKVIFSEKNMHLFSPSDEILRIRDQETFKQGEKFSLGDLHTWIDFLKHCLGVYEGRKGYNFVFRPTNTYEKINEFYSDVESQGYSVLWKSIDEHLLNQAVEQGDIYLFQIYSKDFNANAVGKKNIHTLYFEKLFAGGEENLFKLNGEAEIFRRKGMLSSQIREKSPKHHVDIIEKRRYTQDKLMLHMPITLNFCRKDVRVNEHIKSAIQNDPQKVAVLGIDRGEKHLLYYSLIGHDGTPIKTDSWNVIENGIKKIPYHEKLDARERKRDEAQLNREQQEQIKDLKRGYVSQVVHEICTMIVEHNAIVVLEDLNLGFKRSRQGIEKNVYQQFELALAQKLNYLVFKDKQDSEPGGVLKGYQLTPGITTFGDLKFQTGVVFYTAPGYTSTTCPCCGWRKHLSMKYSNGDAAKKDLSKLEIFKQDDYYTVEYALTDDTKTGKSDMPLIKKQRKLTTKGQERTRYNAKSKSDDVYAITHKLDELFGEGSFDYAAWLKEASAGQCKTLLWVLGLLMKIRNAKSGTEVDVIQCPACGFHSDQGFKEQDWNGDANGAYNIARKGLLIVKKLAADEKTTVVSQRECDNERSR